MSEPVFDANGWATIDSCPDTDEFVWVWDAVNASPDWRPADGGWFRRFAPLRFTHWQPYHVPKPPVGT